MLEIYVWQWFILFAISAVTDVECVLHNKIVATIPDRYSDSDYGADASRNEDTVNSRNVDSFFDQAKSQNDWIGIGEFNNETDSEHTNQTSNSFESVDLISGITEPTASTEESTGNTGFDESKSDSIGNGYFSSSVFEPEFTSVNENLASCLKRTRPCNVVPGFGQICNVYCAVQSIPEANPVAPVLATLGGVLHITLHAICRPIRTAFDLGWKHFVENDNTVYSFTQWQKRMGINVRRVAYKQVHALADMLLSQVVKYANTPLTILREAYEEIDVALSAIQTGSEVFKAFNPGCFGLDFQKSANRLVDIFYRDPNMLDVLLSASLLVVNAGKHIPGIHQEIFQSVAKASEAILGTSCGVLYWAGVRDAYCDQRAGIDSRKKLDINEPYCPMIEVEVFVTIDE